MRLLRSLELTFFEFEGELDSPYAILSHVWYKNGQEVTYEEMKSGTGKEKSGYDKIVQCGKFAAEKGYKYFWIDTCCIDKRSSAELSEAINSMFAWYRDADVCYAYLADVSAATFQAPYTEFTESRWFERGWTLQELLAPSNVLFLSKEWTALGSKEDLSGPINQRTKINKAALTNKEPLRWFSVAERMSWAAFRQTTRIEDRAYSLMGLFGVHMSLLYGEKEKAFIRLQQKIMKTTADQSLFAWKDPLLAGAEYCGLLAKSPDCFVDSACYRFSEHYGQGWESRMTKGGLSSRFYMILLPWADKHNVYFACLDCFAGEDDKQSPVLVLHKLKSGTMTGGVDEYARVGANDIKIWGGAEKVRGKIDTIFVRQDLVHQIQSQDKGITYRVFISRSPWKELAVFPADQWNPQSRLLSIPAWPGILGAGAYEVAISPSNPKKTKVVLSIFGLKHSGKVPWIHLIELPDGPSPRSGIETSWRSYVPSYSEYSERSIIKLKGRLETRVIQAEISSSHTHGLLTFTVQIR